MTQSLPWLATIQVWFLLCYRALYHQIRHQRRIVWVVGNKRIIVIRSMDHDNQTTTNRAMFQRNHLPRDIVRVGTTSRLESAATRAKEKTVTISVAMAWFHVASTPLLVARIVLKETAKHGAMANVPG